MTNISPLSNNSFVNFQTVASNIFQEPLPKFDFINVTFDNLPRNFTNTFTNIDVLTKNIENKGPILIKLKEKLNHPQAVPISGELYKQLSGKSVSDAEKPRRIRKIVSKSNNENSQSGNETMAHLRVLWTALSLALGVEMRGELIRGLPCITRFNQLFCRSGGTSYPSDKIEQFIDENKALIRRMHGEFISISVLSDSIRSGRSKRSIYETPLPDEKYFNISHQPKNADFSYPKDLESEGHFLLKNESKEAGEDNPYVNIIRTKRQASTGPGPLPKSERDRVDACLSEEEVSTPYWASNSRGKILAVVNTNEFSQIIHQEICTKKITKRCTNDCGCEQKYKYHRLMAYDPDNDCKGIFMDWFLFPSCCSCRCDPL